VSTNIRWEPGNLDREARERSVGAGATVWLTGLPGSGKSTIAARIEEELIARGRPSYRLDGDNLRHGLNADLGFGEEARNENVRRAAHVARLFADAGVLAIVSLISPYRAGRMHARELHAVSGLPFIEVFVDTPVEECERRDPKGLYARARRGEITGFTGVDDPYEAPENAEVVVHPGTVDCSGCVDAVLAALELALAAVPPSAP
jgi:bifunctional enzyme CysN/CysC